MLIRESQIVDCAWHTCHAREPFGRSHAFRDKDSEYSDRWCEMSTEKDGQKKKVHRFAWDFSLTEPRRDEGRYLSSLAMLISRRQQKWPMIVAICFIFCRPFYFCVFIIFFLSVSPWICTSQLSFFFIDPRHTWHNFFNIFTVCNQSVAIVVMLLAITRAKFTKLLLSLHVLCMLAHKYLFMHFFAVALIYET